jgi:large subunit ribosomal protein L11
MADKPVAGKINLTINAGSANPSPPVGPALGQHGVNIMDFCNQFNNDTKEMDRSIPIPVIITVYDDRSFSFIRKTPPASYFLKKAAKLKSGANHPGRETVGHVSMDQVRKIAEEKMQDLNANDIEAAAKIICGSARSMGLEVVGD